MVPKLKLGSTILLVLLALVGIIISLQVFSPPIGTQPKALAKQGVSSTPKFNTSQAKPIATNAKIRNPFVPMHLGDNMHDSRLPSVSHSQIPNASTLPVLKGIIAQSGRQFAIIEYNNKSHICAIGNNVSSFTLKGLTAFSAFLEQKDGKVIEIFMGNKK